jgi:Zn-dependent M28 family amino/carboxypeptidase
MSILMLVTVTSSWAQDDPNISEQRYRHSLKTLSSDEFEGRAPTTIGEEKAIAFITDQFKKAGASPGVEGSYLQGVDLVSMETTEAKMSYSIEGKTTSIIQGEHIVALTRHVKENNALTDLDVVFVGHGIVSPEYDWNDYEGVDVKDKIVIILNNDPGYLTENISFFLGRGVTYYARNSYKYEEAERQGARAAFIIQDERTMNGDWDRQATRSMRPRLVLDSNKSNSVEVEGWVRNEFAAELLANSGLDYAKESEAALIRGYKAKPLNSKMSLSLTSKLIHSRSYNVLGIVPGTERPEEYVFYMAHWDHVGKDETLVGDQIFNGARDDASGVSALIELANAFAAKPAKRSVVFMAVTAEESGLLGSFHYVQNPIYPLNDIVGALNLEMMNFWGETSDLLVHGINNSPEMDAWIHEAVVVKQGRTPKPFGRPEAGIAYRSDAFSFNRSGVPVVGLATGTDNIEKGTEWMRAQGLDYIRNHYHKVTDEYREDMDLRGAVKDTEALYFMGEAMANSDKFANWYEGKEFKYLRPNR